MKLKKIVLVLLVLLCACTKKQEVIEEIVEENKPQTTLIVRFTPGEIQEKIRKFQEYTKAKLKASIPSMGYYIFTIDEEDGDELIDAIDDLDYVDDVEKEDDVDIDEEEISFETEMD